MKNRRLQADMSIINHRGTESTEVAQRGCARSCVPSMEIEDRAHPSLCYLCALCASVVNHLCLGLPILMAGCATPAPPPSVRVEQRPPPVVLAVGVPPDVSLTPRAPAVPLYRPPVVVEVEARPYINAANELVVPGKRFVVVDPGGWNPAALEQPERAEIPATMRRDLGTPRLDEAPRWPVVPATPPARPDWLARLPWDQVTVTGLLDPSAEPEANRRAAAAVPPLVSLWTEALGWLLVPPALLEE